MSFIDVCDDDDNDANDDNPHITSTGHVVQYVR